MATITLTSFVDSSADWYGNQLVPAGAPTTHTATSIVYKTTTNLTVTLTGSGLTYDASTGAVTGGLLTNFVLKDAANHTWITATGLAMDAVDAYSVANGWTGTNGNQQGPNSYDLFSLLTSGNDVINGSAANDDLIAGFNIGNDIINGLGGDDYIHGSAGNNTMDGGVGYDWLSYEESFYQVGTAYRGVAVNLLTGTAINPWGGTDTISNFERIEGSRLADSFIGDNNNNFFEGLRGNDTFNGGGGDDFVSYENDARYGGSKAINVNLATHKIIDGFGNTDAVTGIESVLGTSQNDVFVGDGGINQFIGARGVDSYDGGAGPDMVTFWSNDHDPGPVVGAVVNFSLASGQIVNDGFGNQETTVSIEWAWGSRLADTFTGDANDNMFTGAAGNDILDGGAGIRDTVKFADRGDAVVLTLNGGTDAIAHVGATEQDTVKNFEYVIGSQGNDKITGDGLANFVQGQRGNDTLVGGAGADALDGQEGTDNLTGGIGADFFRFDTDLTTGGIDKIIDFSHVDDTVQLDHNVFVALGTTPGVLPAVQFGSVASGHAAATSTTHIIYNSTDGTLWYDADGDGDGTAVQFAVLTTHPTNVDAGDFAIM